MSWRKKKKKINQLIDEYFLSSKIHDYYEMLHEPIEKIIDTEDDYFVVRMKATLILHNDGKVATGIQKRLVSAARNSFTGRCFTGYDMKDTFVSVNQSSEEYSSNIFNLKNLEQHLDSTSCRIVKLFSGRMPNGYYKIAANFEENKADVYVHKSALYLPAFEMLGAFIKEESDREWLVDYMQRIADYQAEVHF